MMGRLISAIALSGVVSVASGFSASEPSASRLTQSNISFPQHFAPVPLSSARLGACPVEGRRRSTVVVQMTDKLDGHSDEEIIEKVITTAVTDSATEDAFSFILFPTLVLKFIVIMLVKTASDVVVYTPQYFERLTSSISLGGRGDRTIGNTASGNTMAISPEAHPLHHDYDETGFSILSLPTLFLKFIVIMMVKSASDAVYYPSQYLERLLTPSQEEDQVKTAAAAAVEETMTTSKTPASLEEEFIEEAAFSLFLLPILLLKFTIVMLVKVAKDMLDYTLPYLESLARLETLSIENRELSDEVENIIDYSEVLWTKDGDYWIKE